MTLSKARKACENLQNFVASQQEEIISEEDMKHMCQVILRNYDSNYEEFTWPESRT